MAERKLAFVVPWAQAPNGDLWLFERLPAPDRGDLIFAAPDHTPQGPGRSALPPYLREFLHLLRRRVRLAEYDIVFTWEMRCALATSLLRRLQRARRTRLVVVGPILKGGILRALPLVRNLLADAETIVCFSRAECDGYAHSLRLPRTRFVFLPTPWRADGAPASCDGGFVLALGKSNRDYPTLLRAVEGLERPVTLVAGRPADLGGATPPACVTVRYNTDYHETRALMATARLNVVPLHPVGYSAGQTVLLQAMACGKASVVSDTPGIRDYVRDGETAVLVPPGDPDALRAAIHWLWNDPAARARIGKEAARTVREEFGFAPFMERLLARTEEIPGGAEKPQRL